MSVELLEQAAEALGELREEVVFVGAATIPLWLTDPAVPAPRPTIDVDLVVEVFTLVAFYRFEARFRDAGFRDEGGMIGRATKLEAFASRGNSDFLGSSDFEDIIILVDGRADLTSEVAESSADLRRYVASEISDFLRIERALDARGCDFAV